MRTVPNHRLYVKPTNTPAVLFEWLSYSTLTGKYIPKPATSPVITHKLRRSISIVWE